MATKKKEYVGYNKSKEVLKCAIILRRREKTSLSLIDHKMGGKGEYPNDIQY